MVIMATFMALTCVAFRDKKFLVWSAPLVILATEVIIVAYHSLIGRQSLSVIFEGEVGITTAHILPTYFIIGIIFSVVTVLIRKFDKIVD